MKTYVNYNDGRWKKYKIDFEKIAAAAGPKNPNAEVSIILTNDAEIHALNRQYRNIDKPTNVLSFELGDADLLGDIYISLDTVRAQAREMGISVADHTAHMVVHGVLHLQGYDHIDDADAEKMEKRETEILKKFGIKNPYATDTCTYSRCDACPGDVLFAWLRRMSPRPGSIAEAVLLAVCGAIAALGFAPFNMWYMTVLGIGTAYWMLGRAADKNGFIRGWLRAAPFGAAYAVAMFGWALHSIYVVPELADRFAIWTLPGVIGFAIAGAIIFGLPFACTMRAARSGAARPFVFAGFWTLVLWMREWVLTGFPWNPVANITLGAGVIANSMSLWGALGLTFIIVGLIAATVEILRDRKCAMCWIRWAAFVLLFVVGAVVGRQNIIASARGVDTDVNIIRIVQPAKDQSEKMNYSSRADRLRAAEQTVDELVAMASGPGNPDIIIFPETTYPFAIVDTEMPMAAQIGKNIVIGAMSYVDGRVYNSLAYADASGQIRHLYHKSHLVPFGEYAPLGGLLPSPSDLSRGSGAALISADVRGGKFTFAPAVCYEIIFSDSLLPRGASADAIINITNDTWFGRTPGVYQHLDMVRRYAIESGLPVVRANYSGISAFVAADGAVTSEIGVGVRGVLDGFVWGAHETPYRRIGRDLWMIIILGFACTGALFAGARRRD